MKKKISKVLSFTAILFVFSAILFVFTSCKRNEPGTPAKKYPADVAIAWVKIGFQ